MKAMIYHGADVKAWEDVPDPEIEDDRDAVVAIDAVTICGTDLHILKGDVPEVSPGRILGHEAIATIEQLGAGVKDRSIGDRVLLSCISSCGVCRFCREGRYGLCLGGGGWLLGHTIDGVQAERARIPFADTSTYVLPEAMTDEQALLVADILPTSFEVGVRNGRVAPGDTVAVVGAGPIGLAAVIAAQLYSPSRIVVVDPAAPRCDLAKRLGADLTVDPRREDASAVIRSLTDGLGADVAIEAVGTPEAFELTASLARPGGHIANIGVHGAPATLHLEQLWSKDVTITTGLVDTWSTPTLLRLVADGRLDTEAFITHRFGFDEFELAYDVFADAADSGALKVALHRVP